MPPTVTNVHTKFRAPKDLLRSKTAKARELLSNSIGGRLRGGIFGAAQAPKMPPLKRAYKVCSTVWSLVLINSHIVGTFCIRNFGRCRCQHKFASDKAQEHVLERWYRLNGSVLGGICRVRYYHTLKIVQVGELYMPERSGRLLDRCLGILCERLVKFRLTISSKLPFNQKSKMAAVKQQNRLQISPPASIATRIE